MPEANQLIQLGSKTPAPTSPDQAKLEVFENRHPEQNYLVPLLCKEFTAICPITGQPDFASFEIVYAPRLNMVESKSLKLYLTSFRNYGIFHEDVTNRIFKDLWQAMEPKYMRILGDFAVRGGIAIKPLVEKYAKDTGEADRQEIKSLLLSWDRSKISLKD